MPSYTTLQAARAQLSTDTTGAPATAQDPILFGYIESASQAITDFCGFNFSPYYLLRGFNGDVGTYFPLLQLNDWPLVEADSILNGDGETITITEYTLLPLGQWPKRQLRMAQGVYFAAPVATSSGICPPWPLSWAYAEDAIQITGTFVWHRNYTRAYKDTGLTLAVAMNTSVTSLTTSASVSAAFDVGSVIKIGTEVMRVTGPIASSLATGFSTTTPTVVRDYDNYTETSRAAAHAIGDKIYLWQTESEVAHAAAMAVAAFYKQRDNAVGDKQMVAGATFGSASMIIPQGLPDRVKQLLNRTYMSHWRGHTK